MNKQQVILAFVFIICVFSRHAVAQNESQEDIASIMKEILMEKLKESNISEICE